MNVIIQIFRQGPFNSDSARYLSIRMQYTTSIIIHILSLLVPVSYIVHMMFFYVREN